jgi:hypothetical protein
MYIFAIYILKFQILLEQYDNVTNVGSDASHAEKQNMKGLVLQNA